MTRSSWNAVLRTAIFLSACVFATQPASAADPKSGEQASDWTHVCDKGADKKPTVCEAVQTQMIKDKNGSQGRLLRLSVAKKSGGKHMMHALLPLGLHLPSGAAVKVDENEQYAMTFTRCTNNGCEAILEMADPLIAQMKKGGAVKIGFNVGAKTMVIPASLKGFTGALNALK